VTLSEINEIAKIGPWDIGLVLIGAVYLVGTIYCYRVSKKNSPPYEPENTPLTISILWPVSVVVMLALLWWAVMAEQDWENSTLLTLGVWVVTIGAVCWLSMALL
jgi:peptidoglycan biosynthesis protein MviN/MurJ (putative lipid II flippase)